MEVKKHKLKIVQWNIRSVNSNRANLMCIVRKHDPDVILLNETWLKTNQNFFIKSYNIIRQDRQDGYGGVATCIKSNIIFDHVRNFSNNIIQSITIKISDIHIINIYSSSNDNITKPALDDIFQSLPNKTLLMGDLNSHHPTWDKCPANLGGRNISEYLQTNDLVILNDGTATLLQPPNQNSSAVDITLICNTLAPISSWNVLPDCGNSDHFPTMVQINHRGDTSTQSSFMDTYLSRNFCKPDWNMFNESVLVEMALVNDDINFDEFDRITNRAAERSIPYRECNKPHKANNPWWDEQCSDIVRLRKRSLQTFNNNPSIENFIEAKRTIALAKLNLKRKKKNKFIKLCESLNRNSNLTYVWQKIKKFSNIHKTFNKTIVNTSINRDTS